MAINLGGQSYTEAQIIAAIAASNDPTGCTTVSRTLEELNGVVESLLLRVSTLEGTETGRTLTGYSVTTENLTASNSKKHTVHTIDQLGRNVKVTFEIPES